MSCFRFSEKFIITYYPPKMNIQKWSGYNKDFISNDDMNISSYIRQVTTTSSTLETYSMYTDQSVGATVFLGIKLPFKQMQITDALFWVVKTSKEKFCVTFIASDSMYMEKKCPSEEVKTFFVYSSIKSGVETKFFYQLKKWGG